MIRSPARFGGAVLLAAAMACQAEAPAELPAPRVVVRTSSPSQSSEAAERIALGPRGDAPEVVVVGADEVRPAATPAPVRRTSARPAPRAPRVIHETVYVYEEVPGEAAPAPTAPAARPAEPAPEPIVARAPAPAVDPAPVPPPVEPERGSSRVDDALIGAAIGAGVGAVLGGKRGAVTGAVLGGVVGSGGGRVGLPGGSGRGRTCPTGRRTPGGVIFDLSAR